MIVGEGIVPPVMYGKYVAVKNAGGELPCPYKMVLQAKNVFQHSILFDDAGMQLRLAQQACQILGEATLDGSPKVTTIPPFPFTDTQPNTLGARKVIWVSCTSASNAPRRPLICASSLS